MPGKPEHGFGVMNGGGALLAAGVIGAMWAECWRALGFAWWIGVFGLVFVLTNVRPWRGWALPRWTAGDARDALLGVAVCAAGSAWALRGHHWPFLPVVTYVMAMTAGRMLRAGPSAG